MAPKLKINISSLKNIKFSKISSAITSFIAHLYKKKILFFTIVGVIVLLIVGGIFLFKARKQAKVRVKEQEAAQAAAVNLFIQIPPGAYPKGKTFTIEPITDADLENYQQNYGFVDNVYNVTPDDGRDEFAIKPLKLKMYIPGDRLLGKNYANLTLAYMKDDGPPTPFPGSYIGRDDNGYFIAASAFHTSKIGVLPVPVKGEEYHGLRLIREVFSVKPGIIVVPGETQKFSGNPERENFWETVFPDRSIYVFDYPLSKPRSMQYMEEANSYFKNIGEKSFIKFESEILAQELKRPDISKNEYHIIAQGIGGIIVLYTLLSHPEITNVRKVVLIGVPYRGTNIANTLVFANMIYAPPVKSAAEILGLSEKTFANIKFHVFNYIETVNDYYKDILPDSEVIKDITTKPLRKDLTYLVIVGTLPPFGIDVKGSGLERLYPELVAGKGDGVVSEEEARLPDQPLLTFQVSFDSYCAKSEILSTIKGFIDSDKLPKPPKLKEDKYEEYLPVEVIKREGLPPSKKKVEEKPTSESSKTLSKENFYQPKEFVEEDVLIEEVSYSIKDGIYNSGGCIQDEPYFATDKALYRVKSVMEKGNFRFMKKFPIALTGIRGKEKVLLDIIGFRSLGEIETLGNEPNDVLVFPDGTVYFSVAIKGVSVKLYTLTSDGERLVTKCPGTYSKLIPVNENAMIFLSDRVLMLINKDGQIMKEISLSSITKEGYGTDATYAIKINDTYFVTTKEHYILIYDEKKEKSWILGEGWMGSKKLLYYKPSNIIIVVGKNFLNFVDLNSKKILHYIQPLGYDVEDAFICSGKLYVIERRKEGFIVHIYPIRI